MMDQTSSRPLPQISRRSFMLTGAALTLTASSVFNSGCSFHSPDSRLGIPGDLLWGVCGHPFSAYPGISFEDQLDMVQRLGFSHYRIDFRPEAGEAKTNEFFALARKRGITILPILQSPADIKTESAETLYRLCFERGRRAAELYRGQIRIWEIGNEEENFAIILSCERRDDGTQYPCEWGPAGGVGPLEYYGPRWKKVSAVLAGLSRGVKAGDPNAVIAMGTSGWGHLGAFDRLVQDGVDWDITVWHDYPTVPTEHLTKLASFKKPIWITEFNAGGGGLEPPEVNAAMLTERIQYYRRMRNKFNVTAAFVYELLDETYWGDTFEARQGLVSIRPAGGGWAVGAVKPPGAAVQKAIKNNL